MGASSFSGTVFLDRDGTINRKAKQGDYVKSVEEFAFLPGAKDALRTLTDHGVRIIIATNQRGIALGRMTEADLTAIHSQMLRELEAAGAQIAAIYHCPHDRDECSCRKPQTGMFIQAASDFPGLVLADSVVIGDSQSDMEAAAGIGAKGILIAPDEPPRRSPATIHRASSLLDAARWLTNGRARS